MQNAASSAMLVAGWVASDELCIREPLFNFTSPRKPDPKTAFCCWKCSHTGKVNRLWRWLNPTPQCCSACPFTRQFTAYCCWKCSHTGKVNCLWRWLNPTPQCCSACPFNRQFISPSYKVVASFPFYPVYQLQTDFFRSKDFQFQGDASVWKNNSDSTSNLIEFMTAPNNPDGQLNKAVLHGPYVKAIHDHAYYWPQFTAIPAPAE
ncbi:hypothetical protein VitviT2T_028432 [Vitis vinifera]|uniref:Alliinase C-terminal domain-containing protein n=1 Tax=Vitis vinifera TaxID=29760 RepID=A0ABY9DV88_VITVI|nr:hypothetical protein VitviT2T_028432 [Vitis vinifera]